jgi:hypothetical protein
MQLPNREGSLWAAQICDEAGIAAFRNVKQEATEGTEKKCFLANPCFEVLVLRDLLLKKFY